MQPTSVQFGALASCWRWYLGGGYTKRAYERLLFAARGAAVARRVGERMPFAFHELVAIVTVLLGMRFRK